MLAAARDAGATPLLLLNLKKRSKIGKVSTSAADTDADDASTLSLRDAAHAARDALDPEHSVLSLELDLAASGDLGSQQAITNRLSEAIAAAVASRGGPAVPPPALPLRYLARDAAVLLVIPMDAETPGGRLLRPQALVQEEALRAYARVVALRLDLCAARGEKGVEAKEAERERFDEALASMMMDGRGSDRSSSPPPRLMKGRGGDRSSPPPPPPPPPPRLVVTDSQAIDVVHEWTLSGTGEEMLEGEDGGEEGDGGSSGSGGKRAAGDGQSSSTRTHRRGVPLVDVTTFSVAMAVRQSGGAEQLALMVEGIAAARRLKEVKKWVWVFSAVDGRNKRSLTKIFHPHHLNRQNQGARVLVAEACNHNRITQACNDIGLVQIPKALKK